jgi:hypothetical protein
MAIVPIEVVRIGSEFSKEVESAMAIANSIQGEFHFNEMLDNQSSSLRMHAFNRIRADEFLDTMISFRKSVRGFHPFIIAIINSYLDGKELVNLFGSGRGSEGVAVCTTANVPNIIIPENRMIAYFLYYFARYALNFIAPNHKNHYDSRGCVFDSKVHKTDLMESMRASALCDECRRSLVNEPGLMTPEQFSALDSIFAVAGRMLAESDSSNLSRAFIGSSTEGLEVAKKLKELLSSDLSIVIWNQDEVFGLGDATLEALEGAVLEYQFGIFVFTPDDEIHVRGETKRVARDNVLFELGLFIGKLGRHRAFVVNPGKRAIALPSDLLGITTAIFDPEEKDLSVALETVCNRIREAVKAAP